MEANSSTHGQAGGKYIWNYKGMHVYDGMVLPSIFPASSIEEAKSFPFEDGDVVICTYPKSGTAWMQEIVWLLHNNADTVKAEQEKIMMRVPNMDAKFGPESNASVLKKKASPRLIKSHLPARIYEKAIKEGKVKFVVVVRNPKDALVSLYNFYKMMETFDYFPGPWSQFFEMYQNKELPFGDWADHVLDYWKLRDMSNVLILTYEGMKKDPEKAVRQVASFCKLDVSEDVIQKTVSHTSFSKMQSNPATNFTHHDKGRMDFSKSSYMRKGAVGDWKNYFTVAQTEWFDDQLEKKMEGCDLHIDFEI